MRYSTSASEAAFLAFVVIEKVETWPNCAGGCPALPRGPTKPLFLARNDRSFLHCGHDGRVSLRRPAMPSRRNGDHMIIAARPAKYVPRVESTSWLPLTE